MRTPPAKRIESLSLIAKNFEKQFIRNERARKSGWGQFLDGDISMSQVGPFGTSSGILALALSDNIRSRSLQPAFEHLVTYWADFQNDSKGPLVQTVRAAYVHLAISALSFRLQMNAEPSQLSAIPTNAQVLESQPPNNITPLPASSTPIDPLNIVELDELRSNLRSSLMQRTVSKSAWSNYWASEGDNDPVPRTFPTALTLLSLYAFENGEISQSHDKAADFLVDRLKGSKQLPIHETAISLAAIFTVKGKRTPKEILSIAKVFARTRSFEIHESSVYFYDFTEGRKQRRDFIICPTAALIGIAGFQAHAPAELRLLAEEYESTFIENVLENLHFSRGLHERVSSVDQAWCALLLHAGQAPFKSNLRFARLRYSLNRQRNPGYLLSYLYPLLALLLFTAVAATGDNVPTPAKILSALGALIISALYGQEPIRRFFWGRRESI